MIRFSVFIPVHNRLEFVWQAITPDSPPTFRVFEVIAIKDV